MKSGQAQRDLDNRISLQCRSLRQLKSSRGFYNVTKEKTVLMALMVTNEYNKHYASIRYVVTRLLITDASLA